MALDKIRAIEGDTINLSAGIESIDDLTGWTCRVQVRGQDEASNPLVDVELTNLSADNSRFTGLIDTEGFGTGSMILAAQFDRTATGVRKEVHSILILKPQAVY